MSRIILHIDQNCYFASVEMKDFPEYRNVPMAVVGDAKQRHGIILAKNQLASQYGVKTAEAIWVAESKCPNLKTIPAHYEKYVEHSQRLKEMYSEYTDKVEPFGLDECWIDVTDSGRTGFEIAEEIRQRVKDEFGLTCSIGVSFNKIFAKLGSDYKKPDATTVITEENFREIVWPLPAGDLLFVGKNTAAMLNKVNIRTIGDIAKADPVYLSEYLGKFGLELWNNANGKDEAEVHDIDYERDIKSVGNSTTGAYDLTDAKQVSETFKKLSAKVSERMKKHKVRGNSVQITVRDNKLSIYEHQKSLPEPIREANDIYKVAMELFEESYDWHLPIRSIGVRCTKLQDESEGVQLSLFGKYGEELEKEDKLKNLMDEINRKFGDNTIGTLGDK